MSVTGKGFSKTGEALIGSVSDDPYDIRTFMKAVTLKQRLKSRQITTRPDAPAGKLY